MALAKRIALFLLVNFLVLVTVSVFMSVAGVRPYLSAHGIDTRALLIFSLAWGMGGALISLAVSRVTAKWFMGVRVIPAQSPDPTLQALLQMVYRLSRQAGITTMPEVGVYESDEVNAFATGPTKNRALVAVSSGLLARMNREEIEGVLGHEVSHVANGDMVTMALLQGVVNAFVIFLSRIVAYAVATAAGDKDRQGRGFSYGTYLVVSIVLEICFMILGSIVVAWYSRYREYRADHGGATLAGRNQMINALKALRRTTGLFDPTAQPAAQALKISRRATGLSTLFSTHPPLDKRIAALEAATGR